MKTTTKTNNKAKRNKQKTKQNKRKQITPTKTPKTS
jgi:hypothetical protein